MTRTFNAKAKCDNCGAEYTLETPFEKWMRGCKELDSSSGIVRFDCDVLVHRYKMDVPDHKGARDHQFLMFVEVKTFDSEAQLTEAQRDTLSLLSSVLRNDRQNIHYDPPGNRAKILVPQKAFSLIYDKEITLHAYGGHILRLSADSPLTSYRMTWDHKVIVIDQLIQLLRFELHPYTLKPQDLRRRAGPYASQDRMQKRLPF